MRRTLVVFARAPQLGCVKRRLARDVGTVAALGFYRTTLHRLLRRVGRDRRWRTVVAATPDRWRPRGHPSIPQGAGDLGHRMARALAACPPGLAVLVGADIPALDGRHVAHAFQALRRAGRVFGPAEDGGFWLVGIRRDSRPAPRDFGAVRWSGPHALADALVGYARDRPAILVDRLGDVDDGPALCRSRGS